MISKKTVNPIGLTVFIMMIINEEKITLFFN